jgi:hypothetical protein
MMAWADWGFVGDWHTGTKWSVTDKLADVDSIFPRPQ